MAKKINNIMQSLSVSLLKNSEINKYPLFVIAVQRGMKENVPSVPPVKER